MPPNKIIMVNYSGPLVLAMSIVQAILLIAVSCVGLFIPGTYSEETLYWQAQSIGQDTVDLFLVTPFLLICAIYASKNNRWAWLSWSGINLYLSYTFVIYCFDIRFNQLFLGYCFLLGLSFYSFSYFLYSEIKNPATWLKQKRITAVMAIYFLIISLVFYFLWLTEIIPAIIDHRRPKAVVDAGLITNPVHVIDLAIFLPGLFIIGMLLLTKKTLGLSMAPGVLVFMIFMSITIAVLTIVMKRNGFEGDYVVAIVMTVLAVLNIGLLISCYRSLATDGSKNNASIDSKITDYSK